MEQDEKKMNKNTSISVLDLPKKYMELLKENGYDSVEEVEVFLQKSLVPFSFYIEEWTQIGDVLLVEALEAYRSGKVWNLSESYKLNQRELSERERRFLNNYRKLNPEGKRIIWEWIYELRLKEIQDNRKYNS